MVEGGLSLEAVVTGGGGGGRSRGGGSSRLEAAVDWRQQQGWRQQIGGSRGGGSSRLEAAEVEAAAD